MLRNYMGILNLEEKETDIRSLTSFRPIATIPIGGRYRVIDFALSNMVNAGLRNVSIFSNKATRSLVDHVGTGKPWDLNRKIGGLFLFNHSIIGLSNMDSKMFSNNMEYLNKSQEENVILSSSYMIANIDLEEMAERHEASGADITLVCTKTDRADKSFLNCDVLRLGEGNRIMNVTKNVGIDKDAVIGMEIFIMKKKLLIEFMYKSFKEGRSSDFKAAIYSDILTHNAKAALFKGYVACINSIDAYYKANTDMLEINVLGELFSKQRPILTKTKDSPPVHYVEGCKVSHSLVADGCIIKGTVLDSLIARMVKIEEDVVVDGCIVLQNAVIKKGSHLSNVIIDKNVVIEEGTKINAVKKYPLVIEKKNYLSVF